MMYYENRISERVVSGVVLWKTGIRNMIGRNILITG